MNKDMFRRDNHHAALPLLRRFTRSAMERDSSRITDDFSSTCRVVTAAERFDSISTVCLIFLFRGEGAGECVGVDVPTDDSGGVDTDSGSPYEENAFRSEVKST